MLTEIIVTNATLVLDGKTIMPGSRLLIKGEPHKSWSGAVKVGGEVMEQRLVVASPAKAELVAHAGIDINLETTRLKYEQVLGKKPHHKMTEQTMLAAIEAHRNAGESHEGAAQ